MRDAVQQLLTAIEADHARRGPFTPAISREQARAILDAAVWLYGARAGAAASIYAAVALREAVDAVWAADPTGGGAE